MGRSSLPYRASLVTRETDMRLARHHRIALGQHRHTNLQPNFSALPYVAFHLDYCQTGLRAVSSEASPPYPTLVIAASVALHREARLPVTDNAP